MNATILKALALDSLYQVLDNKVFRILLVLVVVPVLGTFLFGFREDEIVFLFGVRSWGYGGIVDFFSAIVGTRFGLEDPQAVVVNGFSAIIIDFFAGSIGVMFTIAAASFFVPQMIEKGAADVLFHKPIPRFTLYLSRYFAGLVFIALFAIALVGGMYLGFLLVSGHNDPGLLWAALTLTYVFALVHGVSMLIGVVTRSTVAAILLTIIFFMMNGCVHGIWIEFEQADARDEAAEIAELASATQEELAELVAEAEEDDDGISFGGVMRGLVSTLHYIGPKTTDADYITAKLRAAVEGDDAFHDEGSSFTVIELAADLRASDAAEAAPPIAGAEELFGEPAFHARDGARAFTIWSRPREDRVRTFAGRTREIPETATNAADALEELVAARFDVARERTSVGDMTRMEGMTPVFLSVRTERLHWVDGDTSHAVTFLAYGERVPALAFQRSADDLLASIKPKREASEEAESPSAEGEEGETEYASSGEAEEPEAPRTWERDVLDEAGVLFEEAGTGWYREQLTWDAELKYNLFFSIGSSAAFALLMLLLGWWRLSRIDF